MRAEGSEGNDLVDRLAGDPRLGLDRTALDTALGDPLAFVGTAVDQVAAFVGSAERLAQRYPDAAAYDGEAIL